MIFHLFSPGETFAYSGEYPDSSPAVSSQPRPLLSTREWCDQSLPITEETEGNLSGSWQSK